MYLVYESMFVYVKCVYDTQVCDLTTVSHESVFVPMFVCTTALTTDYERVLYIIIINMLVDG